MKTILAIGAHYDDIEIGCGGTLLKHAGNGDKIFFGITSSDETRTGDVLARYNEQLESRSIRPLDRTPISPTEHKSPVSPLTTTSETPPTS